MLLTAGDTVFVAPGEYVITEPITFGGKAITVRSEAGRDETTIRMGTPTDTNRGSVIIFENGETTASVLDGFTITGGISSWVPSANAYAGGGIYFNASSGSLIHCAVVKNRADNGGGGGVSASYGSSPILTNCIFTGKLSYVSWRWGALLHQLIHDYDRLYYPWELVTEFRRWGVRRVKFVHCHDELHNNKQHSTRCRRRNSM